MLVLSRHAPRGGRTMRTLRMVVLGALVVALQCGCAALVPIAPFQPPAGSLVSVTQAPLDIQFDQTTLGTKQGKAAAYNILGLVAFGDASTQAAATAGNITTIRHADYAYLNVLFLFQRTTVIVYGD
jgi:hypothetical protein